MTRYEMAQIVAKAMAKGANVDRLATEFAEELDGLGVRVAALEQKTDQVQIAGQIRTSYAAYSKGAARMFKSNHSGVMRSRLFLTGKVMIIGIIRAFCRISRILLMIQAMKKQSFRELF